MRVMETAIRRRGRWIRTHRHSPASLVPHARSLGHVCVAVAVLHKSDGVLSRGLERSPVFWNRPAPGEGGISRPRRHRPNDDRRTRALRSFCAQDALMQQPVRDGRRKADRPRPDASIRSLPGRVHRSAVRKAMARRPAQKRPALHCRWRSEDRWLSPLAPPNPLPNDRVDGARSARNGRASTTRVRIEHAARPATTSGRRPNCSAPAIPAEIATARTKPLVAPGSAWRG